MNDYISTISENLKRLRNQRKLSLDKTAALTGISKSMLSQIEKGLVNPSVSTLWKISNGFKISFTELMSVPQRDSELIQKSDIEPLVEMYGHFRNYPIVLFDAVTRFETYLIEIDPSTSYEAEAHPHGTQEYITVTSGSITINVNNNKYELSEGDTFRFKADVVHTYENNGAVICKIHMILYYPPQH